VHAPAGHGGKGPSLILQRSASEREEAIRGRATAKHMHVRDPPHFTC
jgi:hypothetical protein